MMNKVVEDRKIEIFINFVLSEDDKTKFVLYTEDDGLVGEFYKHYEVLNKVRELSYLGNYKVYDDTYEVKFLVENGKIVSTFDWPFYMEKYNDRYIDTFNGVYMDDLIVCEEEYMFDY